MTASGVLRMLQVGDVAPDFTLPSDDGTPVSLAGFRGKPVVVYFYPKDATEDCTTEACGFRDAWSRIRRRGAVVLGISRDPVRSHARFRAAQGLPFPLLADLDLAVAEAFGVKVQKQMFGKKYWTNHRVTFVLDGDGVVRHVFEKVQVDRHADDVLEVLAALAR